MPGITSITGVSSLLPTNLALPGADARGVRSSADKADRAYLRESIRPLAARLLQERRTEKTWRLGPLTVRYESVEGAGQQSKDAARELALIAESFKARQSGTVGRDELNLFSAGAPFGEEFPAVQSAGGTAAAPKSASVVSGGQNADASSTDFPEIVDDLFAARKADSAGTGIWNSSVAASVTRTIVASGPGNAVFRDGMTGTSAGDTKLSRNFTRRTARAISAYLKTATNFTGSVQCMPLLAV